MIESASELRTEPRLVARVSLCLSSIARARPYAPALFVLLLALLATALATSMARRVEQHTAHEIMVAEAAKLRDAIEDVGKTYEMLLRSGTGLINAAGTPTRDSWHRFVASLDVDRDFPGMQGIGYVEVIPPDRIATHEKAQRAAGRPDYRLTPAGARDFYTAIVYLEPQNWRNARAVGFDMSSETVRRRAMDRARDSGSAKLSGLVILMQETSEDVQPGALFYLPFYEGGKVPESIAARREKLRGFIYGAFRLRDLFQRSLARHSPGTLRRVRLQVYADKSAEGATPFFDSAAADVTPSPVRAATSRDDYAQHLSATIGGRTWNLRVSANPAFKRELEKSRAQIILGGGTLLSILAAAVAASLAYSNQRMAEAAEKLSREVAERRRAQEEVQLANGELIHRVKNTLTVVSAIAAQTSRHTATVPEFVHAFRDRLVALGRVHDLLRPDPAYSPDLRSFTKELLNAYSTGGISTALAIDGPAVSIPRNEAVLLSLLFNELATNATKHGAWSAPGGSINVSWLVEDGPAEEDEETAEQLVIVWKEHSTRKVDLPTSKGFGTSVLTAIERGLRGELSVNYEPDGLRAVLRMPVPRLTTGGFGAKSSSRPA